jgi:hypothetical protein
VRRPGEIARRAEQGDVSYLRTVGRVFESVAARLKSEDSWHENLS